MGGEFKVHGCQVVVLQWDMFRSGGLQAANTSCCKALGIGKQVRYHAGSLVKEGPSSTSGESWSENGFLFGLSKSVLQTCSDFTSSQELLGIAALFSLFFKFYFLTLTTFLWLVHAWNISIYFHWYCEAVPKRHYLRVISKCFQTKINYSVFFSSSFLSSLSLI